MRLRKLESKDAALMLEWMHDKDVTEDLKTDFMSKTLDDCKAFIEAAANEEHDLHLAIVSDDDEYMGTVSLKHIKDGRAEFGITVRKAAMGKGYSHFGMTEIFRIGFEERKLNEIFWCVDPKNKRAVRFYEKRGYIKFIPDPDTITGYTDDEIKRYYWYRVFNDNDTLEV